MTAIHILIFTLGFALGSAVAWMQLALIEKRLTQDIELTDEVTEQVDAILESWKVIRGGTKAEGARKLEEGTSDSA